ncbi:MAG TPA: GDCCVxC domain-containing (seleno)protein [Steroidobacteraceae bacterium]|nr:GDCCVxC domain-containing (seleno)protein [Steroidobacteraceae bacterium]
MTAVVAESTLTCSECGHIKTQTMPVDACQWLYECDHCRAVLRPKPGDCCVYCSYGSVPCPPVQAHGEHGDYSR